MEQPANVPRDHHDHHPEQAGPSPASSHELYVLVSPDASFKVGTCQHCVIEEKGRPERAWDAQGDQELDFDRETFFNHLAKLGVVIDSHEAYVCP